MSKSYHATCAITEIRRILQIEENISVSRQTLTCAGRGMVTVHFLPEFCQTLTCTGKGNGRCTFPSRIIMPRKV